MEDNLWRKSEGKFLGGLGFGLVFKDDRIIEVERGILGRGICRN